MKCGQVPKYDNRCRHFTKDEVKEMIKKNLAYCIRFKVCLLNLTDRQTNSRLIDL